MVLLVIGITGLAVHLIHSRVRRLLHLTAPPGSIAGIVSLTSRSGFGELLLPYDTEASMKKKLKELRFTLDPRTGAIVADEFGDDLRARGGKEWAEGVEGAMMALLGGAHSEKDSESGSHQEKDFRGSKTTVAAYSPYSLPPSPSPTPYQEEYQEVQRGVVSPAGRLRSPWDP